MEIQIYFSDPQGNRQPKKWLLTEICWLPILYFQYDIFPIKYKEWFSRRLEINFKLGEQQREFSTLSTITEKKDNYIEIPTKSSFDIEDPEEDSEEERQRQYF